MRDYIKETMETLSGEEKENFKRGLHNLGIADPEDKDALRAAFKRLNPNATERELDIMVSGKAPQKKQEWTI